MSSSGGVNSYDTNVLIEATIREHLTKKGMLKTLQLFNEEKPYTGDLISKSSTLRKALGLEKASSQQKQLTDTRSVPGSSSSSSNITTLEALIDYQLQRVNRQALQGGNSKTQPRTPTKGALAGGPLENLIGSPQPVVTRSSVLESKAEGAAHSQQSESTATTELQATGNIRGTAAPPAPPPLAAAAVAAATKPLAAATAAPLEELRGLAVSSAAPPAQKLAKGLSCDTQDKPEHARGQGLGPAVKSGASSRGTGGGVSSVMQAVPASPVQASPTMDKRRGFPERAFGAAADEGKASSSHSIAQHGRGSSRHVSRGKGGPLTPAGEQLLRLEPSSSDEDEAVQQQGRQQQVKQGLPTPKQEFSVLGEGFASCGVQRATAVHADRFFVGRANGKAGVAVGPCGQQDHSRCSTHSGNKQQHQRLPTAPVELEVSASSGDEEEVAGGRMGAGGGGNHGFGSSSSASKTEAPAANGWRMKGRDEGAGLFCGSTVRSCEAGKKRAIAKVTAPHGELLIEELHIDDADETMEQAQQLPATSASAAAVAPSTWSRQQLLQPCHHSSSSTVGAFGPAAAAKGVLRPLKAEPLSVSSMREVELLLWGSVGGCPSTAWCQGFVFSSNPGLWWGLVQYQGGPCGVLAAVQAHLMVTLMEQNVYGRGDPPCGGELQQHLATTLGHIIWQARVGTSAVVASCSGSSRGSCITRSSSSLVASVSQLQHDIVLHQVTSKEELQAVLLSVVPQWCHPQGGGLLLLLHSLLMSRTLAAVGSDMDDQTCPLVGQHGYCSMELVNLMLTGAAVSNVFDAGAAMAVAAAAAAAAGGAESGVGAGVSALQQAEDAVVKGVARRARVGLLTLFEWYRYVEVGENLKSPEHPVWVVCSESHFTTIFLALDSGSSSSGRKSTKELQLPLELEYYDGLANQEAPIQLFLNPAAGGGGLSSRMAGVAEERGMWQGRPIPPLECVLETKWRDLHVEWRGCEPIL